MWRAPLGTGAKVALSEAAQTCLKPAALQPHKQNYTREPAGQQDLLGGGGRWGLGQSSGRVTSLCI